jgi:uncharacterized protein
MTARDVLVVADLPAVLSGYKDLLAAAETELNRLNVYPVPDRDTGTNMLLTVESVLAELAGARSDEAVCRAVSHGALMGGRGNSGIILSQVLIALADAFSSAEEVGPGRMAAALEDARRRAYAAVADPVEGTILTVLSAAAATAAERDDPLGDLVRAVASEADAAVERTTAQLDVLTNAGVVDAAGLGLALLFHALAHVVTGDPSALSIPASSSPRATADPLRPKDEVSPRYEVVFTLVTSVEEADALRLGLQRIGESIAIVSDRGVIRCHVHTDDVDAAVRLGERAGEPADIEITDLARQVRHRHEELDSGDGAGPRVVVTAECTGAEDLVAELGGVLAASEGGLGPSDIVIGPASGDSDASIVDAPSLPEMLAALLAFDPQEPAATNVPAMREAAARTRVAGALSREGAIAAIDELVDGQVEMITLFAGDGGEVGPIKDYVRTAHPNVSLEVHVTPRHDPPFVIGAE